MTKKHWENFKPYIWLASFIIFLVGSFWFDFDPGKTIYQSFTKSFIEMITFIPFLFIIVGLFDVWFPKEKIEKHIGKRFGNKRNRYSCHFSDASSRTFIRRFSGRLYSL